MTVLRIGEGILSIAEIVGIFYLLFMFSEKRDTRKWKDGLLYLLVAGVCGLLICQRITSGLYSRYFMLICISFVSILAFSFLKLALWKCFLITALYFETLSFFDVLIVYLWALAVKEMGTVEYIQLQTSAERVVIMLISRAILIGMVIWIVNCKTVGRSV